MNVSVVGLGKLGSPLAAVLASRGHRVVGVDLSSESVEALNEGRAPVKETGLAELIAANRERLSATQDVDAAVSDTDVTFLIVPTPSDESGQFALDYVLAACEAIARPLSKKEGYHLLVLTSTVMPGDTNGRVRAALEELSGRRCGEDFGLCYNPEFIALGSVIRDMLHPDFVLIGESDPRAGDLLEELQRSVCMNDPKIVRMAPVNAELTKLALNTFVTTKITYANMLAEVCEQLPGASVDVVTGALGLDTRVGPKYLKGALGYGGPCFPRDNVAFSKLARSHGLEPLLAEATEAFNRRQAPRLAAIVQSRLPEGGTVAILGLSYKPDTDVIEASQGVELAQALRSAGVPLVVFDPEALDNVRGVLGEEGVAYAASAEGCVREGDVVVIATPWRVFQALSPASLKTEPRPVVIDCWRILPRDLWTDVDVVNLGDGPQETR